MNVALQPGGGEFLVATKRQRSVVVDQNGGTNNASVASNAGFADDVGFIIVIP